MKIKVYIHASYCEYEKTYRFQVWGQDMSTVEHVGPLVATEEVEFTPPPHDVLVNGTIEMYRAQQKKVRAEAERLNTELQERINNLLCIEYKPEVA